MLACLWQGFQPIRKYLNFGVTLFNVGPLKLIYHCLVIRVKYFFLLCAFAAFVAVKEKPYNFIDTIFPVVKHVCDKSSRSC